jgi:predicted Zn-dependent protease
LITALGDQRRAVRITALLALANSHGDALPPADQARFSRVVSEFAALSPQYQDDAEFDSSLGTVYLLDGKTDLAAEALQIGLGLEPNRPSGRFLLALARLGQRRFGDARALLQQVPPSDPSYIEAQHQLSLLR